MGPERGNRYAHTTHNAPFTRPKIVRNSPAYADPLPDNGTSKHVFRETPVIVVIILNVFFLLSPHVTAEQGDDGGYVAIRLSPRVVPDTCARVPTIL